MAIEATSIACLIWNAWTHTGIVCKIREGECRERALDAGHMLADAEAPNDDVVIKGLCTQDQPDRCRRDPLQLFQPLLDILDSRLLGEAEMEKLSTDGAEAQDVVVHG
jgi:hypothetical protein